MCDITFRVKKILKQKKKNRVKKIINLERTCLKRTNGGGTTIIYLMKGNFHSISSLSTSTHFLIDFVLNFEGFS